MKALTKNDKEKLQTKKSGTSIAGQTAREKKSGEKNSKGSKGQKGRLVMKPTFRLAFLGLLTAIMFIMAFTPLGYLKTGFLSITFMTIPVIIAAVLLTPLDSAFVGGIFGLTSFIQAVTGASALTGALFQINPFLTAVLCFVPRILEGWLGGLIFSALNKIDKTKLVSYAVTSLSVPLMNTMFFMSTLFLFFYQAEPIRKIASSKGAGDVFSLLVAMAGINAVIEAVVCFIIGTAITKALMAAMKHARIYSVKSKKKR